MTCKWNTANIYTKGIFSYACRVYVNTETCKILTQNRQFKSHKLPCNLPIYINRLNPCTPPKPYNIPPVSASDWGELHPSSALLGLHLLPAKWITHRKWIKVYKINYVLSFTECWQGDMQRMKLEWGCPIGTKYPPRQQIQVMCLNPFYPTIRARVYRQTDRHTDGQGDSSIPPPLTLLRGA